MTTKDRQGREWTIWRRGYNIPSGPVSAIHRDGGSSTVGNAAFLHWSGYISFPEYDIVAYRKTSTANANDIGFSCLREQQHDRECY